MLQKFLYKACVEAINSKGEKGLFDLKKPAPGPVEDHKIDEGLFFGEKFRGRVRNGEPADKSNHTGVRASSFFYRCEIWNVRASEGVHPAR